MIEQVYERPPQLEAVAPLTLVEESEDPRNLLAFVIPTNQMNATWVLDFVSKEQAQRLNALLTSIDVVAQK